jgi:hypothetical protein
MVPKSVSVVQLADNLAPMNMICEVVSQFRRETAGGYRKTGLYL